MKTCPPRRNDFHARQYDASLGRWFGVDPLAVLAPDWSPYRAFFGNPVMYVDPTGLFETRADAEEYMKKEGIQGKIEQGKDGKFTIYDDSRHVSYFKDASLDPFIRIEGRGEDGVIKSGFVKASPLNFNYYLGSESTDWFQAKYGPKGFTTAQSTGAKGRRAQGGGSLTDNVGLAGTIGDPIGGGAKGILDNRGAYLPRGQIYGMNYEITIRTPIANINTTSKVLNYARVGGKVLGVAGVAATGYQVYGDWNKGKYYSAGTRVAVFGVAAGAAFIPVVGWGVVAGIGVADYVWGDKFYNYVEYRMR